MSIAVMCTKCGAADFDFEINERDELPTVCPICGEGDLHEIKYD
jgi:rubrerythrin